MAMSLKRRCKGAGLGTIVWFGRARFPGLLQVKRTAAKVSVRFAGNRINVAKPRPPQYARAKIEYITKPKYLERGERDSWFIPSASQCLKEKTIAKGKESKEEVNMYEQLLAKDLKNLFYSSKLIAFFHCNPIKFDDRFDAQVRLRKEGMTLTKYGKHTVNIAVEGTPYSSIMPLFNSHTEIVFSSESRIDRLLKVASKLPYHVLLAAIVEDRFLSLSQLKALKDLKDITTARSQLVSVLNAHQTQLVSCLTYHQNSIVSGLKQLAEKPPPDTQES